MGIRWDLLQDPSCKLKPMIASVMLITLGNDYDSFYQ